MTTTAPAGAGAELPEPERHLGHLIRRAQQRHLSTWARVASSEITSAQYSILVVLADRGEASQRELCDAVDLDRSTVADLAGRMERRGLIARRRAAGDARRNVVTLTDRGLAERRRLAPLVDEVQRELTRGLAAEDAAALHRGLRQLLERTEP